MGQDSRNEVRESQYTAQASAADLELEKLTEQAALAQYYFEIRGQDMLQQILNETVEADRRALDATQGSYDAGVGDYISVVEAKAVLQSAQSSAINVGLLRAQYEHAIGMLVGKIPTDFSIPVKPMVYAPPAIPTGFAIATGGAPARCGVGRAETGGSERHHRDRLRSAFFPQITISASRGLDSSTLKHLFDWPSRFWSVGPSVSQVVYDGGLYRAQLHQYQAVYSEDSSRLTVSVGFERIPAGGVMHLRPRASTRSRF